MTTGLLYTKVSNSYHLHAHSIVQVLSVQLQILATPQTSLNTGSILEDNER